MEVYGLEIKAIVEALRKTGRTDLVGKSFAVVKLWTQGAEYDFTVPRTECKSGTGHRGFEVQADPHLEPEIALKRRDFTINALQYDPEQGVVIDYFGGRDDLEKGVLAILAKRFQKIRFEPCGPFNLQERLRALARSQHCPALSGYETGILYSSDRTHLG